MFFRRLALAVIFYLPLSLYSQEIEEYEDTTLSINKFLPEIEFGSGLMSFFGDVGYLKLNEPHKYKIGYNFSIHKNYNSKLSFKASVVKGVLYGNEKSLETNLNFEASFSGLGVEAIYNLKELFNIVNSSAISPYLNIGIEFINFKTNIDYKDFNGNTYYYWNDGTIRNLPELAGNYAIANILQRDYNYETALPSKSSLGIPLGVGLKLNLTNKLSVAFSTSLHVTMSDLIDNIEAGGNDKFVYSNFSMRYDLKMNKQKINDKFRYMNVDFAVIEKEDSDNDGVLDFIDRCPETPAAIKVDETGCPPDGDSDGIADYKDLEPNSIKDAVVDINGIKITDSSLAIIDSLRIEKQDTLVKKADIDSMDTTDEIIKEGATYINNLKFVENTEILTTKSEEQLLSIISYIKTYPLTLVISWQAEESVDKLNNKTLSENRLKVIYEFLMNNGVKKENLKTKGYTIIYQ